MNLNLSNIFLYFWANGRCLKMMLKITWSVKTPLHRLSTGVARSGSWALVSMKYLVSKNCKLNTPVIIFFWGIPWQLSTIISTSKYVWTSVLLYRSKDIVLFNFWCSSTVGTSFRYRSKLCFSRLDYKTKGLPLDISASDVKYNLRVRFFHISSFFLEIKSWVPVVNVVVVVVFFRESKEKQSATFQIEL